jgi:tRNA pseudouridine synthase D (TruD)
MISGMHLASGPFRVGDLWGNRFKITIRCIRFAHIHVSDNRTASASPSEPSSSSSTSFNSSSRPVNVSVKVSPTAHIEGCVRRIAHTGFPNFFGSQRMGYQESQILDLGQGQTLDPILNVGAPLGPSVGKMLLLGRYRDAVDAIILGAVRYNPSLGAGTGTWMGTSPLQNARSMYARGVEASVVLSSMPRAAVKERILLKAMVRFGWGVAERHSRAAPGIPGVPCRGVTGLDHGDDQSADNDNYWRNSNSDTSGDTERNSNCVKEEQERERKRERKRERERERESKDDEIASRVIAQLPYSTRSLWVSSYQSWLWNNVASHRLMISSNATDANPFSGERSNTQTQTRTDSSGGSGGSRENGGSKGSGTCADSSESSGNCDEASISDWDRSAVAAVEGLQAMVGDLVHSSSLAYLALSLPLLSQHTDPPVGPDQSNCASASISDHDLNRTRHGHNDTLPLPLSPSDDPVIYLTVSHISSLSAAQRGYLFRHSVLLPLFGKRILLPENSTGRFCSDFHVYCPDHPIVKTCFYFLFLICILN